MLVKSGESRNKGSRRVNYETREFAVEAFLTVKKKKKAHSQECEEPEFKDAGSRRCAETSETLETAISAGGKTPI